MSDTLIRGHIRETQTLTGLGVPFTYFTPKQGYKLIHAEETTWTGNYSVGVDNAAGIVLCVGNIPEGTTLSVDLYFIKL